MKLKNISILTFFIPIVLGAYEVKEPFLWDASVDSVGQVVTGSADESAGYWYAFSDGNSSWEWPSDIKENELGDFFRQMVKAYQSVQGKMIFGGLAPDGEMLSGKPYVGIGFNIWNSEQSGVDISSWEGFCLEYQASMNFLLRLKSESDNSSYENNLEAEISRSDSMVVVDIPWSEFKFESWGPGATKEEILAKTAAVYLLFAGDSGETGEFKLVKFGSLGACNGTVSLPNVTAPSRLKARQIASHQFTVEGLERPTVYRLFDINGVFLRQGILKVGEILQVPQSPAVLKLGGQSLLLK